MPSPADIQEPTSTHPDRCSVCGGATVTVKEYTACPECAWIQPFT